MIRSLKLTVLVDNEPGPQGLRGEHGCAMWVEADGFRLLFDTGQGGVMLGNAGQLGIDLGTAEAVALSHGHYDHTGGLARVLPLCPSAAIYMHPDAVKPRFSLSADRGARGIGMPDGSQRVVEESAACLHWSWTLTEIRPGVFLTGEIPRVVPPEAPASRFFLDGACAVPDPFLDDQALVVDTEEGVVVLLGCSHAGVENTLLRALGLSRSGRLRALIGGMHLAEASPPALERLAAFLAPLEPRVIGPGHCSGRAAREYLRERFPRTVIDVRAGTKV